MYVAITRTLREAGFRATPQRIAIYLTLANTRAHPCAEIVYQKLHDEFPSLSLNTVYKTLQTFEELGLVRRLDTGEGMCRYDANTAPHTHFLCKACGRVLDIEYEGVQTMGAIRDYLVGYVRDNAGHMVCDYSLILQGYCNECLEERDPR